MTLQSHALARVKPSATLAAVVHGAAFDRASASAKQIERVRP